ncbi:MAG: hypothetical protein JJE40_02830 [Vicinamibacteria bacterium]|nr:hypothetical protein [Vicinamibacteria bacterium]
MTPSRRDFLRTTAAGLGGAAVTGAAAAGQRKVQPAPETTLSAAPPLDRVRVGFVGVGGMGTQHLEDYRFITCLREGMAADYNVYDAASWSVLSELAERSVADRSRPQDIPDFTRGKWKTTEPLGIVEA